MDRRAFLKSAGITLGLNTLCLGPVQDLVNQAFVSQAFAGRAFAGQPGMEPSVSSGPAAATGPVPDQVIKDRLMKSRLFDRHFQDDIVLAEDELHLLRSSLTRLKRVQRLVGYGNFCLVGFDDAVSYARSYSRVGAFTKAELAFLEKIFYSPANAYGFMGEKPIQKMTVRIPKKETRKIPRTGNYLYKGKPVEMYEDIRKRIGQDAVLTSGIRGVMKQFLLFLNKAESSLGNLSMASRSLAPPGYSFHGIGDFDVGEKGFGVDNFTEKFTQTRVYNQLSDLGYIKFRYDRENDLGVRFEPWHVEVG
ncbi:MAG: M15 family metallopeptidase [Desulfobacterales bacterium]|nr:M15 family metallopeptidase [Desulfobacterales bacterium]